MNDTMFFSSTLFPGKALLTKEKQDELASIENIPLKHISPSAIRSYLTDRQNFFRRYIRLEFDSQTSPSMLEGSAFHKAMELFYIDMMDGKEDWDEYKNAAFSHIAAEDAAGKVEWGKTGSAEKSMKTVEKAIFFFRADLPLYNPIAVEKKIVADFSDEAGVLMPIPLKTFSDLISGDMDEIDIVDWKLVTSFVDPEEPQPAFEIQAAANFFTVKAEYGKPPRRMIFEQIKKSENKDGSPQRETYVVEFFDNIGNPHPCLKRFVEIYRRILCELAGKPLIDAETGMMQFLPNPYSQFGWKESWLDFCDEIDNEREWSRDEIVQIQENRYEFSDEETADF